MDRTKFPELDPKLKEAYERLMGHEYPGTTQRTNYTSRPMFHEPKPHVQLETMDEEDPKAKLKLAAIIGGLLILFYIYTLIWAAIFNLKLPFSPF